MASCGGRASAAIAGIPSRSSAPRAAWVARNRRLHRFGAKYDRYRLKTRRKFAMSTLRVGDLVVLAAEDGSLLSAEPLRRRAAVRPPSSSWPHVGGACGLELCLAHASPESAEVVA